MDRREESGRVFSLTRLLLPMLGSGHPSHRRSLVMWPLQAAWGHSAQIAQRLSLSKPVVRLFIRRATNEAQLPTVASRDHAAVELHLKLTHLG